MTTPTNDRQTSERACPFCGSSARVHVCYGIQYANDTLNEAIAAAKQLRASEADIAQLKAELAALRAENEALRTVSMDDACAVASAYANAVVAMHAADDPREVCVDPEAMLTALQSFIRSKESRRG